MGDVPTCEEASDLLPSVDLRREQIAQWLRRRPWGLWLLDELPEPPLPEGATPPKPEPIVIKPEHELEKAFLDKWDATATEGKGGEEVILKQLEGDERRREGSVRSVAVDAGALLNALTFLMVTVGLVAGAKIGLFLKSDARHMAWLLCFAFILIMRSHTVRFVKSWLTDYDDAGVRAAKTIDRREMARNTRKVVNRLNAVIQRAKRKQSLAVLLLSIMAVALCAYISFG